MKVGEAIRLWTSRHVTASAPEFRELQLKAAYFLSKLPQHNCPEYAYRAFAVDGKRVVDLDSFYATLDSQYPESFSASLEGVRSFLREGAMAQHSKLYMVFRIEFDAQDLLFNLYEMAMRIPALERTIPDRTGTPLTDYVRQQELVAKPGTLKRAYDENRIRIEGYETREKMYWRRGIFQ